MMTGSTKVRNHLKFSILFDLVVALVDVSVKLFACNKYNICNEQKFGVCLIKSNLEYIVK